MILYQERDFGTVCSDFFNFISYNFKVLAGYVLKFYLLPMVVVGILGAVFGVARVGFSGSDIMAGLPLELMVGLGVMMLVMLVCSLYTQARIFGFIRGYADSEGDVDEAKAYSEEHGTSIFGRLIVFALAVMLLVVPIFLVLSLLFGGVGAVGGAGAIGGLMFMGLAIYILMLFAMIKIVFAMYSYAVGHTDLVESFKQSWTLTNGHWWYVFGFLFLLGIILFIAVFVIQGVSGVLALFMGGFGTESSSAFGVGGVLVMSLLTNGLTMILSMMSVPALPVMYYSLYEKKFGHTLERRIGDIGLTDRRDDLFENEGEY